MAWTENELTARQRTSLQEMSVKTGKSVDELISQAVAEFIGELQEQPTARVAHMQKARGMWRERVEVPDPADLRREWERFSHSSF